MRHVFIGSLFAALIASASSGAVADPRPRPPSPPAVARTPEPTRPEIVPMSAAETAGMLRRLRIYMLRAPNASTAFGSIGAGPQIWFVLPSCRARQPDDPRDYCPIESLDVTALHGAVVAGPMTTVMDGQVPRRVQAFATAAGTDLLRVRLISPEGLTRFEAVVPVADLGDLAAPEGRPTPTGFTIDFTQYPGR
jgi:hypothetical protein